MGMGQMAGRSAYSASHRRHCRQGVRIAASAKRNLCFSCASDSDIRTINDQLEKPAADLQAPLYQDAQIIRALYELDRPVIAQSQGACAGTGLVLALACEVRVCAPSAWCIVCLP